MLNPNFGTTRLTHRHVVDQPGAADADGGEDAGITDIDYIEARGAEDLHRLGPGPVQEPARVLAAIRIGRTRLIDNMAVG